MEWNDLISDEELDLSVKVVTRKTALQIRLDPKLVERLKWKEKRARVQVSLDPGKKRVRLTPASSGWTINDKKARGAEINVRQLLPAGAYTRKCPASIEGEAIIIRLPDDFELKNPSLVVAGRS